MKNTNVKDLIKLITAMKKHSNEMRKIFEGDERNEEHYRAESATYETILFAMTDKDTFQNYCELFIEE